MTEPTPITTLAPAEEPATTPEPLALEDAYAMFDAFVAALREVGQDLKAAAQQDEAA